ncbi:MAG: hypothetical protein V4467_00965 [Patescibacteria group bacterium]
MNSNCYRIACGQLFPGIPFELRDDGCFIAINPQFQSHIELAVGFHPASVQDGFILSAGIGRGELALDCRERFDGYIVAFDTNELRFGEPFVSSTKIYFWPGGENHNDEPLWRHGTDRGDTRHPRQQPRKLEAWALRRNQNLFLAGPDRSLRKLCVGQSGPELFEVSIDEVATYLVERSRRTRSFRGRDWVRATLEEIQTHTQDPVLLGHVHDARRLLEAIR